MTVIHRRTFLQGTAALLAACAARPWPIATPEAADALYRRRS
jgi:hypothetical protein